MLLRSRLLLGVGHGFSTRAGGVSRGRYATLNLGGKWGDDAAHVAENRRRVAEAGGFALAHLHTARQVHGVAVVRVEAGDDPAATAAREADALVSSAPGVTLGVYTADCVPILLADDEGRVAAVHAGWRGTVAGVAAAAVKELAALGAAPGRLRAAFGPSICARSFEVGEEVAEAFARVTPEAVVRGPGRPHVDLWAANRALLIAAGLAPGHIDAAPPCSHCDAERFFSFRRDGAQIGQMLSFITAGLR
jgi:YfiH family protein